MRRREAREEIQLILKQQKTVSVSRLKRIWDALGYEELLQTTVSQGKKIKRQQGRLRKLEQRSVGANESSKAV